MSALADDARRGTRNFMYAHGEEKWIKQLAEALFPYYQAQQKHGNGSLQDPLTTPCLPGNVRKYIIGNYDALQQRNEAPPIGRLATLRDCYDLAKAADCYDVCLWSDHLALQVASLVFSRDLTVVTLSGDTYTLVLPDNLGGFCFDIPTRTIQFRSPIDVKALLVQQHPKTFASAELFDLFAFKKIEVFRKSNEETAFNTFDGNDFSQSIALQNAFHKIAAIWK